MDKCPKCGGDEIGDGYTSVIHCEYTDESKYEGMAPDEGPVWCDYENEGEKYEQLTRCNNSRW